MVDGIFHESVTLSVVLWTSRTGYSKTDSVLNRLIRGSIQTGLFASLFSLGDLATFLRYPDTNLYGMFAIPIGRIYTNVSASSIFGTIRSDDVSQTLLDTLLARDELREVLAGSIVDTESRTTVWLTTSPAHDLEMN